MEEFNWGILGLIIPLAGMSIPIVAIVTEHKRKQKALEVLRQYAEQGAEPPQSVIEAIGLQTDGIAQARRAVEMVTGPAAFPKAVFFLVMALGFAAVTWFFYAGGPRENWVFVIGFGIPCFALAALAAANFARGFLPAKTDER